MKKETNFNIFGMYILMSILMVVATITGCQKDDTTGMPAPSDDGSNLNFVLKDNFNFSMVYAAVSATGLSGTLGEKGPYTVFVPNNNAFSLVGISEVARLSTFYTNNQLTDLLRYGIVNEKLDLKKMPLENNKAFKTLNSGNIYVS